MKAIFFTIIIVCSFNLKGQTYLKGKYLLERLDTIDSLLKRNNFEEAISLFEDKNEIIVKEKLKNKDFERYSLITSYILYRKKDFNTTDSLINSWNILFEHKKYEELLIKFHRIDHIIISKKNIPTYELISSFLSDWGKEYEGVFNKYVKMPQKEINTIPNNYNEAIEQFEKIDKILSSYQEKRNIEGETPELNASIVETKQELEKKKKKLELYIEDNIHLTHSQIDSLFKTNISIKQIEQYANYIKKDITGIYIYLKMGDEIKILKISQLMDLVNLDVIRYYELRKKYDTELKQETFKNTKEYQDLYEEMKKEYDFIKNMYFFMPVDFSCYDNQYDIKKHSFYFSKYLLDGHHYGYNTGYLQFSQICMKKPSNILMNESRYDRGRDSYLKQEYYIPIKNENIAIQIENNCKSSALIYVFKLKEVEKIFDFFNNMFLKVDIKRIMIYDKNTNHIHVDYTY